MSIRARALDHRAGASTAVAVSSLRRRYEVASTQLRALPPRCAQVRTLQWVARGYVALTGRCRVPPLSRVDCLAGAAIFVLPRCVTGVLRL